MTGPTSQCMMEPTVPRCLVNAFPNEVWTRADQSSSKLLSKTFASEKKRGVRFPDVFLKTACRIISWAAHVYCFLQSVFHFIRILYFGSVIQIIMNYGVFCTSHKESETKISTLPLSLFISAFQESPVYFFLLIFHILFKETEVSGFCVHALTHLSFFSNSLLWYTQCSHFTRSIFFCATVSWIADKGALERRFGVSCCCRGSREKQTEQFVSALC